MTYRGGPPVSKTSKEVSQTEGEVDEERPHWLKEHHTQHEEQAAQTAAQDAAESGTEQLGDYRNGVPPELEASRRRGQERRIVRLRPAQPSRLCNRLVGWEDLNADATLAHGFLGETKNRNENGDFYMKNKNQVRICAIRLFLV